MTDEAHALCRVQDENNICKHCGGSQVVRWNVDGVPFTVTIEPPFTVESASTFHLCTCPVLPEKHDGNLDTYANSNHASVWWEGKQRVYLSGGYGRCKFDSIYLDPQQALSLLKWLQQERPALEKLAVGDDEATT